MLQNIYFYKKDAFQIAQVRFSSIYFIQFCLLRVYYAIDEFYLTPANQIPLHCSYLMINLAKMIIICCIQGQLLID